MVTNHKEPNDPSLCRGLFAIYNINTTTIMVGFILGREWSIIFGCSCNLELSFSMVSLTVLKIEEEKEGKTEKTKKTHKIPSEASKAMKMR